MHINKGNLLEKFDSFSDHWNPRIIGQLNGQAVKIAKIQGEFVWHSHENEDEMFYVVKGAISIELRDKMIDLQEGEFTIIPKGVEHKPSAKEEAFIMMFEPLETLNTGNIKNELTRKDLEEI